MTLFYVALGGAIGAAARYGLGSWIQARLESGFPWSTFVVNLIGSFLIGVAMRYLDALDVGPEARALLTAGLLGGFTTFSAFSYEVVALLQGGEWTWATLYVAASLVLGVVAVFAGLGVTGWALAGR